MPNGYKLSKIYVGQDIVRGQKYPTESIIYKMNADSSGNLYVPLSGSAPGGTYATYSWKVSVDGGPFNGYSGTGSNRGKITLSGYTSGTSHIIIILPTTEAYQWARAYGWYNVSGRDLLTEVIYDGSYMGYGVSATDTGAYFRYAQYYGCTGLTTPVEEYLPDTVTTIGANFLHSQYYGCTGLTTPAEEVFPSGVTSIGNYFRYSQYQGCTSLTYSAEEETNDNISVGQYFRGNQYSNCSSLTEIKGWREGILTSSGGYYRSGQYYQATSNKTVKVLDGPIYSSYNANVLQNNYITTVYVPSAKLTDYINSAYNPRSSITDSKFVGY